MKQLRLGIVGTGMAFERLHWPALQQLREQYRIVALCDRDPELAKGWARRLGLSESDVTDDPKVLAARDDVDVVSVMVPIEENFTVARQVAEVIAGSHKGLICEKPLAPDMEQARLARKLPEKYSIPVLIAENYRYNHETKLIRRIVDEKRIGDALYFIQNRVIDTPEDMRKSTFAAKEWRQHPDFPGGVILDTGVHDIAALHYVFGAIEQVQAYGVPQEEDFAPFAVLQANLKFRSGVIGQFSFFCAGKEMQRPLIGLRIFGTQGMIYLEERDAGTVNIAYNDGRSEQIPYEPQAGYREELLNFYNHLVHGEPLESTPEIEFGDTHAMLAILRSAQDGQPIPVEREPASVPM